VSAVLPDRAQLLLKALIERYVQDGQPVGSRTLARDAGLELSPASIRNVMQDLEEMGFIRSPHTSAGRVPTVRGYRFFVDSLLSVKPLEEPAVRQMQHSLGTAVSTQELASAASGLLSAVTHLAGMVTLPRIERMVLRHIEFLPLSGRRVLVILVVNGQEVQNRVLHLERDYGAAELSEMANFLNARFHGQDLARVRERLLEEMRAAREDMNQMMLNAIAVADAALQQAAAAPDLVIRGESHLLDFAELSPVDKLRELFQAFNQKRDLLHLLDHCVKTEGVQIFIGEESGYEVLDECSLVTAPYAVDGQIVGVLGVIGPTRMAYDRVIPIVDLTARLLGAALKPAV
jgi:heat-inducible transcriptional repressor